MDAYYREQKTPFETLRDVASELDAWFAVSGDMDDFIYYGDTEKAHSEK